MVAAAVPLAALAEDLGLELQLLRLGNNSHGLVDQSPGAMQLGTAHEPSLPHWHALFRGVPGCDFLGIGVPLLADGAPVGTAFPIQAPGGFRTYPNPAHAGAVVDTLRHRLDTLLSRHTLVLVRADDPEVADVAHGTIAGGPGPFPGPRPSAATEVGKSLARRWRDPSRVRVVAWGCGACPSCAGTHATTKEVVAAWGPAAVESTQPVPVTPSGDHCGARHSSAGGAVAEAFIALHVDAMDGGWLPSMEPGCSAAAHAGRVLLVVGPAAALAAVGSTLTPGVDVVPKARWVAFFV